jgi:hypothetical protein
MRQDERSFDESSFFDALTVSGADVFFSGVLEADVWFERFL